MRDDVRMPESVACGMSEVGVIALVGQRRAGRARARGSISAFSQPAKTISLTGKTKVFQFADPAP